MKPRERDRPAPGLDPDPDPAPAADRLSEGAEADIPAAARRVTASVEETERLGETFANGLVAGDVLALTGPLGSGKTRFVAGLARGLGARSRVRSPSFTLLNEYRGALTLHHLDLYRLEGRDVHGLGLEELVDQGVLAVEWGEKLPGWLRADALTLVFDFVSEHERAISASPAGERGLELLAVWRSMPVVETR